MRLPLLFLACLTASLTTNALDVELAKTLEGYGLVTYCGH